MQKKIFRSLLELILFLGRQFLTPVQSGRIMSQLSPFFRSFPARILFLPSKWKLTLFPARILVQHMCSDEQHVVSFQAKHRIEGALATYDLIKGKIFVQGCRESFFRYCLTLSEQGHLYLQVLRGTLHVNGTTISKGDPPLLLQENPFPSHYSCSTHCLNREEFHFGSHRPKEVDRILRDQNLDEIAPIWLRMGAICPPQFCKTNSDLGGGFDLFPQEGQTADYNSVLCAMLALLFPRDLVPEVVDAGHQGFCLSPLKMEHTEASLSFLEKSSQLFRSCLIRNEGEKLFLLPHLPKGLPHGKGTHLSLNEVEEVSFRWNSKRVRSLSFSVKQNDATLDIRIAKANRCRIKSYLKNSHGRSKRKGQKQHALAHKEPLELSQPHLFKAGYTYHLDRFTN